MGMKIVTRDGREWEYIGMRIFVSHFLQGHPIGMRIMWCIGIKIVTRDWEVIRMNTHSCIGNENFCFPFITRASYCNENEHGVWE